MQKSRLLLSLPVYTGLCVFNLSEHLMYDFYYNQLKAQYGDQAKLLYTETVSLFLEIQMEDVY